MKQINLLLFTLCLFSCSREAELNVEPLAPASALQQYITNGTESDLLGADPMVILDGALKSVEELELEAFQLDEGEKNTIAMIDRENEELLKIFGEAASDGLVIIRTREPGPATTSPESFNANRVLILVNGKATGISDLNSILTGKIAAIHIIKSSTLLAELTDIGYEGIVQVETR